MAKQKVYGLPTLTPVNYDRRTGEYNDPLKGVSYDHRTGNYYDAFAEDGGEYVSPQQYKKKYGLRALAQGGRVEAGEPVIVGDGGREEMFVPDSAPQYQGRYRRVMDYINSGKQMDMAPQPAIPRSDEEWAAAYNTPIPKDQQLAYEKWKWDQSRQRGRDITRDLPTYDIQGAALEGLQRGGNGHFSDKYKKPSHEGFSTDSQYNGLDGYEGGQWGYNKDTQREVFTPGPANKALTPREAMMRYVNAPGEKPVELMEDVGGKMMNTNIPGYGLRALARGGYVERGEPVIVGDGGQPELFVPDQSGYVYPEVPQEKAYRTRNGDGLTQDELNYWDQQMAAGDAQRSRRSMLTEDEYYAQKDREAQAATAAQEKANWIMRPMAPEDANRSDYGEKYYKTLGHQGVDAVAGMPVPKNYAPPIGITNRPNDPDMMRLEQIRQEQGYSPKSAPDQYPNVPMGGVGLSAMQNPQQPQVAPTQVQAAQSVMDTINNGTPRQSILAAAKAAGYGSADIIQGQDGSMQLVSRGSGPIYSGGREIDPGTQTKVIASFRPGKAGLEDVSAFLHTVLTPQQQKNSEGLIKYTDKLGEREFEREKLNATNERNADTYNRGLAAMYAKELDAAQKAHTADIMNSDKPFDREAFDKSFDEGLARFGVTPKTGQTSQQPQVGLGRAQPQSQSGAVTPEYQDLYNLQQQTQAAPAPTQPQQSGGSSFRGAVTSAPQQAQLPPQALSRLKEGVVTRFGSGQAWTLQNGQPVQVRANMAPSHTPQTGAPQAAPPQQEAPQVGLGQPAPMQPQGPAAGERASQAVSSAVNPQRGNEPSPDWQDVAALPEKLESQHPGIVKYLTSISQAHRMPFNTIVGILTAGGEGAAKLWQGFQRARQTGSAY